MPTTRGEIVIHSSQSVFSALTSGDSLRNPLASISQLSSIRMLVVSAFQTTS
jgi:hypothetical protein